MVELTEKEVIDTTGCEYKDIVTSMVQDGTATYVARALDYSDKTCDMHNGDKVNRSTICELVRKDGRKNTINSFIGGKNVVDLFRKKAQHNNTNNNYQLFQNIQQSNNNFPNTKLKHYHNDTHMSAMHNLSRSSLRLKPVLDEYF